MIPSEIPEAFIFMKVGNHANETFEEILVRKRKEIELAGRSFWGYGGFTCHPVHHVQPFCRLRLKEDNGIYLLMEEIDSRAAPEVASATEYSTDGIQWLPIPTGITVTGSRYALVLEEISPGDLDVRMEDYAVGVGKSRGRLASEYLRGHVDKGCFVRAEETTHQTETRPPKHISLLGKLVEPYGVLLRGES